MLKNLRPINILLKMFIKLRLDKKVNSILKHGANPNITINKLPALIYALKNGYSKEALLLIKYGADVTPCDTNLYSPLHYACSVNISSDVIKKLVEYGADVNATNIFSQTPLFLLCINEKCELMKYLINSGANIETRDIYKNTLLHISCCNHDLQTTKYLLRLGLNIDSKNDFSATPLEVTEPTFKNLVLSYIKIINNIPLIPKRDSSRHVRQIIPLKEVPLIPKRRLGMSIDYNF